MNKLTTEERKLLAEKAFKSLDALETIINLSGVENCEISFTKDNEKITFDFAKTIKEAIYDYVQLTCIEIDNYEKATPTKPNIWGDGYDEQGNMIFDMYDCPNCDETYEIDYEAYDYCPKCGQAIDWSEDQ